MTEHSQKLKIDEISCEHALLSIKIIKSETTVLFLSYGLP